jgi:hypothetical protein
MIPEPTTTMTKKQVPISSANAFLINTCLLYIKVIYLN